MSDPYRTASEPSPQRPPRKRWYIADNEGQWWLLVGILILAICPACGFVVCGFVPWVMRAVGLVVGFLAQWCLVFVRRSATPPKGAFVIGGDDE